MTTDNPATLDLPVALFDGYSVDWFGWDGKLQAVIADFDGNECVGLDNGMTEEEVEAYREAARVQEEQRRKQDWNRPEVLEAKEKGILP